MTHSPTVSGGIVEHTFAWPGRYCRLSNDCEYVPHTSEAMIRVVVTHLMVRRLVCIEPSYTNSLW
jgi:hypothetical protein